MIGDEYEKLGVGYEQRRTFRAAAAGAPLWLQGRMSAITQGARKLARGSNGTPVVLAATVKAGGGCTLVVADEAGLDEVLSTGPQREAVREALPPGWLWLVVVTEEGTAALPCGPLASGAPA